jgi:hypothetical protein
VEPLELILIILLVAVILYAVFRGGTYRRGPRAHYRRGTHVRNRRLF